ncbi:outer membrane protein [Prosthecomicrobium sp. N25]|uniref:outer membrane protein n=1 Tax=Prosthecomicrobium sp. N25 TaxID=3129254 RepID=UPI0030779841
MSRVLFVALAAIVAAAAGPASAADIYAPSSPAPSAGYTPYAAPALPSWSGAYAGVHLGGVFGSTDLKTSGSRARSADTQGALGGVFGGVNAQVGGNFVVGGEADVSLTSTTGSANLGGRTVRAESDWNATVRGRVGVAFGRVMPYGTAGLAFVDSGARSKGGSDSATETGIALGGGVEGLVTDRITARAEYMYLGVGESRLNAGGTRVKVDPSTNILRAGVGYKF